jgi:hypothetical protein
MNERMKDWFKDFLDDISGVLFMPSAALKKIAGEKKVLQAVIILFLSGLLPDISGYRHTMNENILRPFVSRDIFPGLDGVYPALTRAMPYIVAFMIISGILIIPLLHFIFTAVVELACQFLTPGKARKTLPDTSGGVPEQNAINAGDNVNPITQIQVRPRVLPASATGVGLFTSMAFATLPMILMVPVNLLSTLTGINLSLLSSILLRLWVVVLQVISVRETHGFTTGRATLAYFALPLVGIAVALVMIIMLLALVPFISDLL